MIKHIVMWNLKEGLQSEAGAAQADRLKAALEGLKTTIPEIMEIEVGINIKEADAACDVSLYTVFENAEALAAYQQHPDHQAIVGFVKEIVSDRHVVDYVA